MVLFLKKKTAGIILLTVLVVLGVVLCILLCARKKEPAKSDYFAGGKLCAAQVCNDCVDADSSYEDLNERYHRPSKKAALKNSYTPGNVPARFDDPESLLLGYYGVLREAANMAGYTGGCGSIGDGTSPFPIAYEMFSKTAQSRLTQQQFTDSFSGVGHTTLLTLQILPGAQETRRDYMVEVEMITGYPADGTQSGGGPGLFVYYYGVATAALEEGSWKIDEIRYIPEDFLCAPYHSWFYDAAMSVPIIYKDNLGLVETIQEPVHQGGLVVVTAQGDEGDYLFDFVRLTNGYDILIGEYIRGQLGWEAVDLLDEQWDGFKLQ